MYIVFSSWCVLLAFCYIKKKYLEVKVGFRTNSRTTTILQEKANVQNTPHTAIQMSILFRKREIFLLADQIRVMTVHYSGNFVIHLISAGIRGDYITQVPPISKLGNRKPVQRTLFWVLVTPQVLRHPGQAASQQATQTTIDYEIANLKPTQFYATTKLKHFQADL